MSVEKHSEYIYFGMQEQTITKYSIDATEFMKSHIREYCDDLQALDTILQNRDRQILFMEEQHFQLLRQLEVLQEDNDRLYDIETKNVKLHQRIRSLNTSISSLQSYNFEMQSSLHTLKKRKCKLCNHNHECGCDKDLCQHCRRQNIHITYIIDNMEIHKCDNNNCTNYYLTRFENCQCHECMFCQFRQENEERDNVLSEIEHAEAQEAQHAASMEQHMQQQIEQRINDNSSTQNNE